MEEVFNEINQKVSQLVEHMSHLQSVLADKPASKQVRDGIREFRNRTELYKKEVEAGILEKIAEEAKMVSVYATITSQGMLAMQGLDESALSLARELQAESQALRSLAENNPALYTPLEGGEPIVVPTRSTIPNDLKRRIDQIIYDQEKQDTRIKNSLLESEKRIHELAETIQSLEQQAEEKISNIDSAYKVATIEIASKQDQINNILGHASGRVIAGDYETSAANEKGSADWLRKASIGCMAFIVAILGYSVWETTKGDFQWQSSVFRVVLAFLMSAPAAYLARESTKHRVKQYQFQQTSLDLKSISPYISSLPDDVQHKIKTEAATRLFSGKESDVISAESYPLNSHEIVMELIKKLEIKVPDQSSK